MGKNGKKSKSNAKKLKLGSFSVSLLTPTVKSRDRCLPILAKCIASQTYLSNIKEWIIVTADAPWR